MADNTRLLITRLSALGDILHALPLLGALRAHWPNAHIGWLVEPAGAQLLRDHPLLNALHIIPKRELKTEPLKALRGPARELLTEIKNQNYEVSLDIQGLTKSAAWPLFAGIARRIALARPDSRELAPFLTTESVTPPPEALHVVERNLSLLRPFNIIPQRPIVFPVHLPQPARDKAAQILSLDPTPLVILACGAGWETKIWPPDRFGQLAQQLVSRHRARVALSWGPGEEPLVARALAAAHHPPPDFNIQTLPPGPGIHPLPRTTFIELGAIIARARLFVGGDTGPTHFAAALNVPVVSMMGPLDSRRNGPYGPLSVTIQHAIPAKPPRGVNHRRWCDPATRMDGITVEEVLAACEAALAAPHNL